MRKIASDELGKLAYVKLKEMIISNHFKPGQKIVQEKLALDLGISRTPLRDAIKQLEAEYLLESIPRRGVVVRSFSNEEIVQIYDCRIALEGTAARILAEIATSDIIEDLSKFFEPFEDAAQIDPIDYGKADSLFHEYIIKNCGNQFISRLFDQGNIMICIDRIGLVRTPEETLPEHRDIIDAISRQNQKEAEFYLKEHLFKSRILIHDKVANG